MFSRKILQFTLISIHVYLFSSCHKEGKPEVIATVGSEVITYQQVDQLIQDQLYENLFEVYRRRSIALDELVSQKVFTLEARERKMSLESLLSSEIYEKAKQINIDSFLLANALENQIPSLKNPMQYLPINSDAGKAELARVIEIKLTDDLAARLKTKFGVRTFISQPQLPKKSLAGIDLQSFGDQHSDISFTLVTDIDCSVCHSYQAMFDSLIADYSDKVHFEIVSLSDLSSLQSLISEYAFQEGKYWEFVRLTLEKPKMDSVEMLRAYEFLTKKSIDWHLVDNLREKMTTRAERLGKIGIQTTPTILINHRIYYGARTVDAISEQFK